MQLSIWKLTSIQKKVRERLQVNVFYFDFSIDNLGKDFDADSKKKYIAF